MAVVDAMLHTAVASVALSRSMEPDHPPSSLLIPGVAAFAKGRFANRCKCSMAAAIIGWSGHSVAAPHMAQRKDVEGGGPPDAVAAAHFQYSTDSAIRQRPSIRQPSQREDRSQPSYSGLSPLTPFSSPRLCCTNSLRGFIF